MIFLFSVIKLKTVSFSGSEMLMFRVKIPEDPSLNLGNVFFQALGL